MDHDPPPDLKAKLDGAHKAMAEAKRALVRGQLTFEKAVLIAREAAKVEAEVQAYHRTRENQTQNR